MDTRNLRNVRTAALLGAVAAVALPSPAEATTIDLSTFNPRFEDAAGATPPAAPAAAGGQPSNADPVAKLREEFNRNRDESLSLVSKASNENRALTDAEAQQNETRFTRMKAIERQIEQYTRIASLALPGVVAAPASGGGAEQSQGGAGIVHQPQSAPPGREAFQRVAVKRVLRPGQQAGESDAEYFDRHVEVLAEYLKTGVDKTNQFVITRGINDGAIVPTRLGTPQVLKAIANPWRAALAARNHPVITTTDSAPISIPVFDDLDNLADEIAETATGDNPADPDLDDIELGAKLYDSKTVWISNTMLNSTPINLFNYVDPMLDDRIARRETALWTTAAVTAAGANGVTTVAVAGVTYAELVNLKYSLPVRRRRNGGKGVFIVSDAVMKIITTLQDGSGQNAFFRSASDGEPDRFLDWPIFVSEQLAAPAANAISALAVIVDGVHIRDVTPTRVVRYEKDADRPDRVGIRKFKNGDFYIEADCVRRLRHAAA